MMAKTLLAVVLCLGCTAPRPVHVGTTQDAAGLVDTAADVGGTDATDVADESAPDVLADAHDAAADVPADATSSTCCTTNFDCPKGERCVGQFTDKGGVCKPIPAWGSCWDFNDCVPSQECQAWFVCPCNGGCKNPDLLGQCVGSTGGCCTTTGVCPGGEECFLLSGIGWSTCLAKPEPGRCWQPSDCPAGQTCEGAGFCPCNTFCDGASYQGPGVCTPPAPACTPILPAWVLETCDAANLVVWDGSQCVATCPGCCGCAPFCSKTFGSIGACLTACH